MEARLPFSAIDEKRSNIGCFPKTEILKSPISDLINRSCSKTSVFGTASIDKL
jgi:hypothetical protein